MDGWSGSSPYDDRRSAGGGTPFPCDAKIKAAVLRRSVVLSVAVTAKELREGQGEARRAIREAAGRD